MSSKIIASTTSGTALNMSADTSGVLEIQTGSTPTTAITVDASQNVGIGVTPSAWNTTFRPMQFIGGGVIASQIGGSYKQGYNWYFDGSYRYIANSTACRYDMDDSHRWYTATSGTAGNAITFNEAMRIDSSGNLLVGTTSSSPSDSNSTYYSIAGKAAVYNHATGTGSGQQYIGFTYAGTYIGSISQNGTTAVLYNTTSDYRLKNSVAPMTGALAKIALLKPCTYKWNSDNSDGEGFIAHELAEVCPHAVTGEKDAVETYVDEDGNEQTRPVYQGIDTSFLVATLTAAIQEIKTIIDDQAARLTALENK